MLQEPWPSFLNYLDADPMRAGREFCEFALKFFTAINPRFLHSFNSSERSDAKQEICLHCISDDFRVLRQYRLINRGFGSWFYVIAHNKAMDLLRKSGRTVKVLESSSKSAGQSAATTEPALNPHGALVSMDRLRVVVSVIRKMDEYCQLLLRMGADELTPIEMTRILRWRLDKAKKISDDLRYCREKLRGLLRQVGVDLAKST